MSRGTCVCALTTVRTAVALQGVCVCVCVHAHAAGGDSARLNSLFGSEFLNYFPEILALKTSG